MAVVTGASSGIGRAIALELAAAGAHVLVHARQNRKGAEEVAEHIRTLDKRADVYLGDLASRKCCRELVESAWNWGTQVDIWVNNAGVDVLTGPSAEISFEEKLEQLWRVDVLATMNLSRQVGQLMKDNGGAILNVGWDQAATGMAGDSGEMFATAKGAVMAFTKSLAKTFAPSVRVNCVAPGWIRTAWARQASSYWQERATEEALLNRWGTPEDVARAARFLVSPHASFLTGQIVNVNGGLK